MVTCCDATLSSEGRAPTLGEASCSISQTAPHTQRVVKFMDRRWVISGRRAQTQNMAPTRVPPVPRPIIRAASGYSSTGGDRMRRGHYARLLASRPAIQGGVLRFRAYAAYAAARHNNHRFGRSMRLSEEFHEHQRTTSVSCRKGSLASTVVFPRG